MSVPQSVARSMHSSFPEGDPSTAAIAVDNVEMRYKTSDGEVLALERISFRIEKGQFVSIVGPSGCGKSTLLMIIAGLIRASSGRVWVHGTKVDRPISDLGFVFQKDLLLDWRSVLGNVLLQADVRGMPRPQATQKALNLLRQVGLEGFENRNPWELSGGMRQRVAICRALLPSASTLLMDEPFGALDALTRDRINLDLQLIWSLERPTALLITHSISEAIFLSDRVLVMSGRPGHIIDDVRVELPRPRTIATRDTTEFVSYQHRLRMKIGE
jgi:NitT/TauT family transport system ATP-binding protein